MLGLEVQLKTVFLCILGKMLSIIEVVAKSLAYVKTIAIAEVNKTRLADVDRDDIHWVLTVPAIWTDAAKVSLQ
jgi:hypothetical protein